jgi:hypothetical protein
VCIYFRRSNTVGRDYDHGSGTSRYYYYYYYYVVMSRAGKSAGVAFSNCPLDAYSSVWTSATGFEIKIILTRPSVMVYVFTTLPSALLAGGPFRSEKMKDISVLFIYSLSTKNPIEILCTVYFFYFLMVHLTYFKMLTFLKF